MAQFQLQILMSQPLEQLSVRALIGRQAFKLPITWQLPITPALKEPLPGWVDNMNGPTGVMIGAAKGVIRSMLCNGDFKSDIIPVDIAINGLIVLPYHCSLSDKKPERIPVFNLTITEEKRRTWKWVMDIGRDFTMEYPFEVGLWYPDGNMTMNKAYHWFCVIFFMWLPAYLIDFLMMICGQRRFMVRVQTKIATGLDVLQFFTTRAWDFKSMNFHQVYTDLTPSDRLKFKVNTDDVDDTSYMLSSILGGRQYVMKEPLSSLPKARAHMKMMYFLDRICKTLIGAALVYWLALKLSVVGLLSSANNVANLNFVKN